MPVTRSARRVPHLPFDHKLILNQWFFGQLGVKSLDTLIQDGIREPWCEKTESEGTSGFCRFLKDRAVGGRGMSDQALEHYDAHILRHTAYINAHRPEPIHWRYFQYLTLLASEVYLDRWFRDRHGLLTELNDNVWTFNEATATDDHMLPYAEEDLHKIAFWWATGSGKTLLMHMNMLQYRWYLEQYGHPSDIGHVVLLTPNEALSAQHMEELRLSGIRATLFDKGGSTLFDQSEVQVIDINKLGDNMGEKTVAVDAFGSNNLLFVDEGHLGTSGRGRTNQDERQWMKYRNLLCARGFDFEYSATFGQAMAASNDDSLRQDYARCILFDYSYKYFYHDGYGKDYHILNLADSPDTSYRRLYLTGALLTFYQQLAYHRDTGSSVQQYLLDRPLLLLLSDTITAQSALGGKPVTDVIQFLLFLAGVTRRRSQTVADIERILSEGILDADQHDIFAEQLSYLVALQSQNHWTAVDVYNDLLRTVFHAQTVGKLRLERLKRSSGEISLCVGSTADVFGLINVGDPNKLISLCKQHSTDFAIGEDNFREPLFDRVHADDSPVNVLLGAKKFVLGWNSWRVSTMGLMNVGRSEGSEIIQLFGRGVRLRGRDMSMKRSSASPQEEPPRYMAETLETLNVFGVRADYMTAFKKNLEEEGVPTEPTHIVLRAMPIINWHYLKIPRLPSGLDFRRDGPSLLLALPTDDLLKSDLRKRPIELKWFPRVQAQSSRSLPGATATSALPTDRFTAQQLAFLDWDQLYYRMEVLKHQEGWFNLALPRGIEQALLQDDSWYRLYVEHDDLRFTSSFDCVDVWQQIAFGLLARYCDRYYGFYRDGWESMHMELVPLAPDDPNIVDHYDVYADPGDNGNTLELLTRLRGEIEEGKLASVEWRQYRKVSSFFERHLYQPLLSLQSTSVTVSPVALNAGEAQFVHDLGKYYEDNRAFFADKELYLLRNRSRGTGVGFFEGGNLYPDFIMWLVVNDHQYITFIDPKGIMHLQELEDPKIQLAHRIKTIQHRLNDPTVTLNSFILSITPEAQVPWGSNITPAEWAADHVLFQDSRTEYIGQLFSLTTASIGSAGET